MTRPYLGNPKYTIEVLQKYGFVFQKRFGQNFLIDTRVLDLSLIHIFPMLCKLMEFYPPFHGYTHVDKVENYPRNL